MKTREKHKKVFTSESSLVHKFFFFSIQIIEDTFIFVFLAIDIHVEMEKYNRDKITFTLIVLMNFFLPS